MHTDPETRFPISAVQMPCIVKQIFDFKPWSSVYREERGGWIVLRYYPFVSREAKRGVNIEFTMI